jgi:alpha-tubulin suppressor-like RCC1 family protein
MKTKLCAIVVFVLAQLMSISDVHADGLVAAWGDNNYGQTTLPVGVNNVKAIAAGPLHNLALRADGTVAGWGKNVFGEATAPAGLSGVTAIAAGEWHSLALRANGTVVAWGSNTYGQTNLPSDLSHVIAIAAGFGHNLALKADGTVVVWGLGSQGQTNIPTGLSNVVAIAAGQFDNLALKVDGTVAAWGYDFRTGQTNVPAGLSNVVAIATGYYHSLALKADGTVVAWGSGPYGQTNVPPGLSNVVAIAAGTYQSLALKADGTVAWWGLDNALINPPAGLSNATAIAAGGAHGLAIVSDGPIQILQNPQDEEVPYTSNADFSVTVAGSEPLSYRWLFNGRAVTNSSRVSGATNATLNIADAQFDDIGTYTVIASNAFGSVVSAGATLTVVSPPFITSQSATNLTVGAGADVAFAGSAQGTPPLSSQWLFNGANLAGATGATLSLTNLQPGASGVYSLRFTNLYGSARADFALTVTDTPPYIVGQPVGVTVLRGGSATFAVSARGSLPLSFQWRFNGQDIADATNAPLTLSDLNYGQMGYYDVAVSNLFGKAVSVKVYLSVQPVAVWGNLFGVSNAPAGLTNLVAISAGNNYLLGLKADGTVAVWGNPVQFPIFPPYLKTNLVDSVTSVTNVPAGLSNVTAIAAGAGHALALKADGIVVAWGDDSYGQTNVPAGLSNVVAIAAGADHSLALTADGRLMSWGSYQPTPSRFIYYSVYVPATNTPAGLSNVIAIAAGADHDLAVKNDGTIVAWGLSGTTNVPTNLSNAIAVACGATVRNPSFPNPYYQVGFNLALQADGTVVSWNYTNGVYGLDYSPLPSPPVVPAGLSNVVAIAANNFGMALKADGSVITWGLTPSNAPPGLANVIAIAAGNGFAAAVGDDGSPFFTIQPANQTVTNGATARFHARAVGLQPMRYQWQFNGANLAGATNGDLTTTNIQGRNVGDYQLVAANALGMATSKVARLSIPFNANLAAALNATNLVWETFMSTNKAPSWFAENKITHDGDAAAQSGPVVDNQQSYLTTTLVGPGTLTFWWKVSSEESYDFLSFYLDDAVVPMAAISGEVDWRQETFTIPSGTHIARWIYAKDASVSAGQDAGWLDQVAFTPDPPLRLSAPRRLLDGSFVFAVGATNGSLLQPDSLAGLEVQASTDLVNWVALTNALTLTNGVLHWRDAAGSNYPLRFYRVMGH